MVHDHSDYGEDVCLNELRSFFAAPPSLVVFVVIALQHSAVILNWVPDEPYCLVQVVASLELKIFCRLIFG